jgi:hypothetical protein
MINRDSPTLFTSALLVTDTYTPTNGSSDSFLAKLTEANGSSVSAALEIRSTEGGILLPRMTTTQVNNLNATGGMIAYDETLDVFKFRQGNAWVQFGSEGSGYGPGDPTYLQDTHSTLEDNLSVGTPPPDFLELGEDNVTIGCSVGTLGIGGDKNTLIGSNAGNVLNIAVSNATGVGYGALRENETNACSAFGSLAGYSNTTGSIDAFGSEALTENVDGENNTGISYRALASNVDGDNNTGVGRESIYSNVSGSNITAVGYKAANATTVDNISAFGSQSLLVSTGASMNAFGANAFLSATTAANSCAFGTDAGRSLTTGSFHTLIGNESGYTVTTNSNLTAVGYQAARSTNANNITAIGYRALRSSVGNNCTAVGANVLPSLTVGQSFTAIGANLLPIATSSGFSTFVGADSGALVTTGHSNTCVGQNNLNKLTTSSEVIAIGRDVLNNITAACGGNVAIGNTSLVTAGTGGAVAAYNVSIGGESGSELLAGERNIFIGHESFYSGLSAQITANNCIVIGSQCYSSPTTITNAIAIGNGIVLQQDNSLVLGKNVNVGIGTETPAASAILEIASTTGALLLPRMSTTEVNALTAVNGMSLYDSTLNTFKFRQNGAWVQYGAFSSSSTMNAFGSNAFLSVTSAANGCAFGTDAGRSLTTGSFAALFGNEAGYTATTTSTLTAVGYQAARATNAANVTAVGYKALLLSTGANNTAVGANVMVAATTPQSCTAVGANLLPVLTTGSLNTFVGADSGILLTTGSNTTSVGQANLIRLTTSSGNIAIGKGVLNNIAASCSFNVGIGNSSLTNAGTASTVPTVATNNVGLGVNSGLELVTGSYNTFIGADAFNSTFGATVTANSCIVLGAQCYSSPATLSNSAAIGNNIVLQQDNTLVLGNNMDIGIGTETPSKKLHVVGDGVFTGNVGAGTISPSNVLHVFGTAQFQGITSGYANTGLVRTQYGRTTTGAGTATIDFAVPTANRNIRTVQVTIAVMNTTGDKSAYSTSTAAAFWNGATTAQVGTLPTITMTTAGYSPTAAWSISGNNLRLTVTGVASNDSIWVVSAEEYSTYNSAS